MATRQRVLIVTTRLEAHRLGDLRRVLASIDRTTEGARFSGLKRTHFLRWAILEERPTGRGRDGAAAPHPGPAGPALLLTTVYDGRLRPHLRELAAELGEELRAVYGIAIPRAGREGWPPERIVRELRRTRIRPSLFFNGTLYRTTDQIEVERRGWRWLREKMAGLPEKGARDTLTSLRAALSEARAPRWIRAWKRRPTLPFRPRPGLEIVLVLALLTALTALGFLWATGSVFQSVRLALGWVLTVLTFLFVVVGAVHAVLFGAVARLERRELARGPVPAGWAPDNEHDGDPADREDVTRVNEVTHLAIIKPTRLRMWTLRTTLFWINLIARFYAARALNLGGIRSIHFAYWVILKEERRLLFVAHYDGTFERYLEDFALLGTHYGVNAIWSNCLGFPQTRRVFRGGAREQVGAFIDFGRAFQHATQVWYRAYPTLPAAHINRNTAVRDGLVARSRLFGIRRWVSAREDWTTLGRMS